MRPQRRRAVPELEQGRLRGTALHVLGAVRNGALAARGQGGVRVGVGLGGRRQQEIPGEVHACDARARAVRRQAAGRTDRLDAPAPQPHVHGAPVGEPCAAQQDRGRVGRTRAGE